MLPLFATFLLYDLHLFACRLHIIYYRFCYSVSPSAMLDIAWRIPGDKRVGYEFNLVPLSAVVSFKF